MNQTTSLRTIVLMLGLLTAIACSDTHSDLRLMQADDAGNDALDTTPATEDTSAPPEDTTQPEEDVALDIPEDVAPLIDRSLVVRPLMGSTPVNNFVSDPRFQSIDGRYWLYIETGFFADFASLRRTVHLQSPTGLPSVSDPNPDSEVTRVLIGQVKAPAEPSLIAVWVGDADMNETSPQEDVTISLIGMNADGNEDATDLVWSDTFEDMDGVRWWKAEVQVEEPPLGFASLSVQGLNMGAYYLHAPVVVPVSETRSTRTSTAQPWHKRSVLKSERRALSIQAQNMRNPPPPVDPQQLRSLRLRRLR